MTRLPTASESNTLGYALERLMTRMVPPSGSFTELFDPEWRSPCEIGTSFRDANGIELIHWLPKARSSLEGSIFAGLERALEIGLHPAAKRYYEAFWGSSIEADAPDGPVSLIQLWNEEDTSRLIENLIGHALQKRRARAPLTIFFATTGSDSDYFLSIDNATGQVLLEEPGRPPARTVAETLTEFLDSLERPAAPTATV